MHIPTSPYYCNLIPKPQFSSLLSNLTLQCYIFKHSLPLYWDYTCWMESLQIEVDEIQLSCSSLYFSICKMGYVHMYAHAHTLLTPTFRLSHSWIATIALIQNTQNTELFAWEYFLLLLVYIILSIFRDGKKNLNSVIPTKFLKCKLQRTGVPLWVLET